MPRTTRLRKRDAHAIREAYHEGVSKKELKASYHISEMRLRGILGDLLDAEKWGLLQDNTDSNSLVADFVAGFEARVVEYHTIIAERTQERDDARNEAARLHVALTSAVNGGRADLEQLEAAGRRISSPLGGGSGGY